MSVLRADMRKPGPLVSGSRRARIGDPRARTQQGITLLELLIVLVIVGGLIALVTVNLRNVQRVELRSGVRFMAATLRYGYDRARFSGRDLRLVFDLSKEGGTSVEFEIAAKGKRLQPRDLDAAWKEQDALASGDENEELERRVSTTTIGGLSKALQLLQKVQKPQWQKVPLRSKGAGKKLARAARLVKSIYLARLDDEISEGKVAFYIWGGGRLERAAIYLSDGKGTTYTLVTHPLTGRVVIHDERVNLSKSEMEEDDSGETIKER